MGPRARAGAVPPAAPPLGCSGAGTRSWAARPEGCTRAPAHAGDSAVRSRAGCRRQARARPGHGRAPFPRPERGPGPGPAWPERSFVTSGGRRAASRAGLTRRGRGGGRRPGDAVRSMEPRAGCRLPVRVEQVVNGALVVTVSCGERSFAGILLDCTKKSGLFALPPSAPLPQSDNPSASSCLGLAPEEESGKVMQLGPGSPPPPHGDQPPETATGPEPPPPLMPPLPTSSPAPYPPYFEGAPFPHPLWLRNTYGQWVPQPPPRTIKRARRRLSRNREPGRLTLSTIRLRPRQVLCERCKRTLSPPQTAGPPPAPRARRRLGSGPDGERPGHPEPEEGDAEASACARKSKRERREDRAPERHRAAADRRALAERVPRSPVIRISYSTPQGKGEVVQIPSRVHGSLEPFRPPQAPLEGSPEPEGLREAEPRDGLLGGPSAAVPKLKLTRPTPPSSDLPPPKIRLKPHRLGDSERKPVYRAELVQELNGCRPGPVHGLADSSSGSSSEEEDLDRCPQGQQAQGSLAFLVDCPKGRAGCASESVCGSDSLDESKSSSSEATSPDTGDLSPSSGASVPSSSREAGPTVPPLTVRLHTQSVSQCVTEDGRTLAVGDIVWGLTVRRRACIGKPSPRLRTLLDMWPRK
ncbi:PWWP domain-containing protein 2B isoform X2 [Nycticebus coucang]|uniref:PWWP domain-containing protein 2B isoform X2 n=1 Tax=Nycticebus coucang TaxID=9470 RepID=UPI00234DFC97|nr:PWWP domain-containing protein 2B isoform X2 [Nycticebus coucang]XP_053441593.1 PWWP domain-containing protein 2B isoform X2 [Nycticebus coucang]